ncbi:uncharacterized protein LODBEIA_P13870 [Lodderomyces beijingensis]|uniref:PRP1 splicing factor N-terminal domain-containing protein n=1 Tax=Lodderomyces beijingensis TaxID=1775926 RepID=A0ABP0ZG65_9ASCO
MSDRLAFLNQEAPEGYVAGVGRGTVGFSTGVDTIYNSRNGPGTDLDDDDDDDNGATANDNESGLLASRKRTADEEEEDRVYEALERKLQSRRKTPKSAISPAVQLQNQTQSLNRNATANEKRTQFNDLKHELSSLSEDDWLSIPEAGDMTRKNKRQRVLEQQSQRLYAVPDSILAGAGELGLLNGNGNATAKEKNDALSAQLDNLFPAGPNHNSHHALADSKDLEQQLVAYSQQDAKFADLKKGRLVLASLRKNEPYKSSSWIMSSRLEEEAREFSKARDIISQGCKMIPGDEDVWIENIRLNRNDNQLAKRINKEALSYCSTSEKLWLKSVDLETETRLKKRNAMRGLEDIPRSVPLWKALIDLESDEKMAQKLLVKATALCASEWEFWLGLVNLSSYDEAKQYLNKARKSLEGDLKVWIAACKLEEREHSDVPDSVLVKLTRKAVAENSGLDAEAWYAAAIEASNEGFKKTCNALVTSYLNAHPADAETLMRQADDYLKTNHTDIAHRILDHLISTTPEDVAVWEKLLSAIKKSSMGAETLFAYYRKAIDLNSQSPTFYLMYASDLLKLSSLEKALEVLNEADAKLNDDTVKIAIIDTFYQCNKLKEAITYVSKLVSDSPTRNPKFWTKYIHMLRCEQASSSEDIIRVCDKALTNFPNHWQLYDQKIRLLVEDLNDLNQAREVASHAVKILSSANANANANANAATTKVWIAYSQMEEKLGVLIKARSILDTAMLTFPRAAELGIAKLQLEQRQRNFTAAKTLANVNIKLYPANAHVWYQYLSLIPKMSTRKNEFVNALQKTQNSSEMLMFLGVFFWRDGKFAKAQSWFERSRAADGGNGDAWGWSFNYLKQYGTQEERGRLVEDFAKRMNGVDNNNNNNRLHGRITDAIIEDPKCYGLTPQETLDRIGSLLFDEKSI